MFHLVWASNVCTRPIYVVSYISYIHLCDAYGLCTAALAIKTHWRRVEVHGGFQLRDIPLILLIVVRLAERSHTKYF